MKPDRAAARRVDFPYGVTILCIAVKPDDKMKG